MVAGKGEGQLLALACLASRCLGEGNARPGRHGLGEVALARSSEGDTRPDEASPGWATGVVVVLFGGGQEKRKKSLDDYIPGYSLANEIKLLSEIDLPL